MLPKQSAPLLYGMRRQAIIGIILETSLRRQLVDSSRGRRVGCDIPYPLCPTEQKRLFWGFGCSILCCISREIHLTHTEKINTAYFHNSNCAIVSVRTSFPLPVSLEKKTKQTPWKPPCCQTGRTLNVLCISFCFAVEKIDNNKEEKGKNGGKKKN